MAERLALPHGHPVIMENRPGAGATIGTDVALDGRRLFYGTPGPQIINPSRMPSLPRYPERNFTPTIRPVTAPDLLVVDPFFAGAIGAEAESPGQGAPRAAHPRQFGASSHSAGEMLKQMAGADIIRVPARGSGPAIQELLAGRISRPNDRLQGRTPGKPSLMPDLPTVAETLPGFDVATFSCLAVPVGTPAAIVPRWNRGVSVILASAGSHRRLGGVGLEPFGRSAAATAATILAESARWRGVIVAAGIEVE